MTPSLHQPKSRERGDFKRRRERERARHAAEPTEQREARLHQMSANQHERRTAESTKQREYSQATPINQRERLADEQTEARRQFIVILKEVGMLIIIK